MKKQKGRKKTRRLSIAVLILAAAILALVVCGIAFGKAGDAVTIELDAGHGGDSSGYQGLASEDTFDEEVVNRLYQLLEKDRNFKVKRTHEAGTAMSVKDRAAKANEDQPDLVISIHCSSSDHAEDKGGIIFADIPSSSFHEASLGFADALKKEMNSQGISTAVQYYYYAPIKDGTVFQEHIVDESDTTDYQQETLDILTQVQAPCVQVRQIYVTNQDDVDKWASEEGYDASAQLYYNALKSYFAKN